MSRFGRIPALDGVRGMAILAVLVHHGGHMIPQVSASERYLQRVTETLWIGVDLFFVLSGCLITGILLKSLPDRNYFSSFYFRRALRIFPVYYAALIAVYIVAGQRGAGSPLWQIFFLSNWGFLKGAANAWLLHFWSLSVEEQFYSVWPLLTFLIRGPAYLLLCFGLTIACWAVRFSGAFPTGNVFTLTVTRFDGLALGAAVAFAMQNPALRSKLRKLALPILCLSGLILALLAFERHGLDKMDPWVQRLGYGTIAIGCAALVAKAVLGTGAIPRFFESPFLRSMGRYSYAMYVVNWPLALWTQPYLLRLTTGATAPVRLSLDLLYILATAAASYLLALLSWHLLEKRALAFREKFSVNRDATPAEAVEIA